MKLIVTPPGLYKLVLASCDLEELCLVIEARLTAAAVPILPAWMRKNVGALATAIWNLDMDPGPRQARQCRRARMLVAKCAAKLYAAQNHLPSEAELYRCARELLSVIMGELDHMLEDKGVASRLMN